MLTEDQRLCIAELKAQLEKGNVSATEVAMQVGQLLAGERKSLAQFNHWRMFDAIVRDSVLAMVDEVLTPTRESDKDFKERILEKIPAGALYTAEDLGNAVGEQVDVIGRQYNLKRL